jgi:hypothetical protein
MTENQENLKPKTGESFVVVLDAPGVPRVPQFH